MLIQNGYLRTTKFATAPRTSQNPWAIQVILPHPRGVCAWYWSLARGNFSQSLQQQELCFLVKWLWTGLGVDSIETKAQKQSVIPEAIPRASASCSFIPAAWFVLEVTSTVPSLNSSILSPGYLVVTVVWRSGFCFHLLLLFLLISSYLCGIGMCPRLPWALPHIFHEQQGGFGCFTHWEWLQKDKQAQIRTKPLPQSPV